MDVALVFLPLIAAAIAGLFGRFVGDRGAQAVTCLAMLASLALAGVVFNDVSLHGHARTTELFTWFQTGSFEASTPALSRMTPSVTSAVTLRFIMRIVRISPKMPAEATPMASATAMQPSGMSSIAPRVEIGFAQLAGVARSSRTGTKRSVKAGPTMRRPVPPENGIGPLIQQCRMPFLSSMVVMVAVVIFSSVATSAGDRLKAASDAVN